MLRRVRWQLWESVSGKGMGDSIGVLLKPSELSGSANALESHHIAVGAHARPQGGRTV